MEIGNSEFYRFYISLWGAKSASGPSSECLHIYRINSQRLITRQNPIFILLHFQIPGSQIRIQHQQLTQNLSLPLNIINCLVNVLHFDVGILVGSLFAVDISEDWDCLFVEFYWGVVAAGAKFEVSLGFEDLAGDEFLVEILLLHLFKFLLIEVAGL